jgi:hypothetical protein
MDPSKVGMRCLLGFILVAVLVAAALRHFTLMLVLAAKRFSLEL